MEEGSDQQTTLTLDRSGRVLRTKLVSDGDTFYFDHIYNGCADQRARR